MGDVYLAEQVRLGNRRVAVKVVPLDDAADRSREAERHCLHEAELLGRFSHPHILPIHDSGYDRGLFYLVTHYAPDGSLADALRGGSHRRLNLTLAVSVAADLVSQVASALQYTHGHGVVHNDVKPGNILIDRKSYGRWHLLLADFGLAACTEALPEHTRATGTAAYMAPERFAGHASPASDQYALAVIAFQLLTGHVPFEGDTVTVKAGHLDRHPPRLRSLNPLVPAPVEAVILRALAKDPAERYPSVVAFAAALQRAAQETDVAPEACLALEEAASAGSDPDTLVLNPLPAAAHSEVKYAASDPVTIQGVNDETRPLVHVTPQPAIALNTRTPRVTQEARFLAVGIACLLLLLLVAVASSGLWSIVASHGGDLTKSLTSWGTQGSAQPISHGQVVAPPPLQSGRDNDDGAQQPVRGSDRAAPVPHTLAITALPGARFEARFSFANTGDTIWSHASGYTLTCASQRHPHATCLGFAPISFGSYTVLPGDRFTFKVLLTAPERTGNFAIWLNVGHAGQLFGTRDLLLNVKSRPATPPTPKPNTTPSPQPTATPQPTPQPTATPEPTATPMPQPTVTPAPTVTPQTEPTATPADEAAPTATPDATFIPLSRRGSVVIAARHRHANGSP
jgi:hypothetical protein